MVTSLPRARSASLNNRRWTGIGRAVIIKVLLGNDFRWTQFNISEMRFVKLRFRYRPENRLVPQISLHFRNVVP